MPNTYSLIGTALGAGAGALLGNPMLGASLGGAAGGLLGGGGEGRSPSESRRRERLRRLSETLLEEADTPVAEREGYQLGMADVKTGLREQAEDDAGRASARGLSGGRAVAAGTDARAKTLARLQRGLLEQENARTPGLQSRAAQLLMGLEGFDEREADRKTVQRGQWINGLTQVGGSLASALLGEYQTRSNQTSAT